MARLFRHSVLLVALLGLLFETASPGPISAADPAPYYENLTQSCTTTNYVKPCHNRDSDDAYFVYMAECSSQITTFC